MIKRSNRSTPRTPSNRALAAHELRVATGGADLESAGEELKTAIVKGFWSPQLGNSLLASHEYFV